jgi:hypothetical protein
MHTQYNLILAAGIVREIYAQDCNVLVLCAEFTLDPQLLENMKGLFDEVYIARDHFMEAGVRWHAEKDLFHLWNRVKKLVYKKFDRVFLSQDRELETTLLSSLHKNSDFELIDIEEDCYYSIDDRRNYLPLDQLEHEHKAGLTIKSKLWHTFVKAERTLLYGRNTYYYANYFYGMNPKFNAAYVLYPSLVRTEMQNKTLMEVDAGMLCAGIESLYHQISLPTYSGRFVLYFFDLIERYRDSSTIEKGVCRIVEYCAAQRVPFICKLHPRETRDFEILKHPVVKVLDKVIPGEKLLYDLQGTLTTVIGNVTTVCQVAKKMGFKVISISKMERSGNEKQMYVYERMGIELPECMDEMLVSISGK